jgi:hypothetical protein
MEIDNYNNVYHEYIKHPNNDISIIYNLCMNIIRSESISQEIKETVLSKLIFIIPENIELYYFMGCIIKNNNAKSSMWFRLCLQHCKIPNIENFLDLTKYLFDNNHNNYIDSLLNLYPEYTNSPCIHDIRICNLIICNKITNKTLENIEDLINTIDINTIDNNIEFINSCFLYYFVYGDMNNAFKYSNPYIYIQALVKNIYFRCFYIYGILFHLLKPCIFVMIIFRKIWII